MKRVPVATDFLNDPLADPLSNLLNSAPKFTHHEAINHTRHDQQINSQATTTTPDDTLNKLKNVTIGDKILPISKSKEAKSLGSETSLLPVPFLKNSVVLQSPVIPDLGFSPPSTVLPLDTQAIISTDKTHIIFSETQSLPAVNHSNSKSRNDLSCQEFNEQLESTIADLNVGKTVEYESVKDLNFDVFGKSNIEASTPAINLDKYKGIMKIKATEFELDTDAAKLENGLKSSAELFQTSLESLNKHEPARSQSTDFPKTIDLDTIDLDAYIANNSTSNGGLFE
jgi:hypothetical protein